MQVRGSVQPRWSRLLLGCVLAAAALTVFAPGAGSLARAAGTRNLDELMSMKLTDVDGKRVSALGNSSGTVAGKVSFKLVLSNGSHAAATFHGRNAHGTITGTGVARYRVSGAVSYYTGTVTSLTGTGAYAKAAERGISFSGSVNRRTYRVTMHLLGKWHV